MSRKYFTLAVRPNADGNRRWSPQFGDYDKATVEQEKLDTKDQWPRGTKFKVISTGGRQADINRAIDALNAKEMK